MPGGGIGGIVGGLVGGMGGPGGMGGMGGMGRMAGMNGQNQMNAGNMQPNGADLYDVDRWKRADGMDAPTSNVQMVRDAWDRKDAEKKEKSLLKKSRNKIGSLLQKKKNSTEQETAEIPEARPAGGTIHTAEMKKAERNLMTEKEEKQANAQRQPEPASMLKRQAESKDRKPYNYLGLQTPSSIEDFFTSNPLNSVILAVDSLSMGVLGMNQVRTSAGWGGFAPDKTAVSQAEFPDNAVRDPEMEPAKTDYMNMVRENRENRKYDVHIV